MAAISSTALAVVGSGNSNVEDGYYEEWQLDSCATEHFSPDGTGMADDTPAELGTTLEIADGTFVPMERFGAIGVIIRQKTVTRQQR